MNFVISWAADFAVRAAGSPGQGVCCLLHCLNVALMDTPGMFSSSSAGCFTQSLCCFPDLLMTV